MHFYKKLHFSHLSSSALGTLIAVEKNGDNTDTVYTDYVQYNQLQALRNANVVRKWCELITSINPNA